MIDEVVTQHLGRPVGLHGPGRPLDLLLELQQERLVDDAVGQGLRARVTWQHDAPPAITYAFVRRL